jgi:hypothetical protein
MNNVHEIIAKIIPHHSACAILTLRHISKDEKQIKNEYLIFKTLRENIHEAKITAQTQIVLIKISCAK